MLAAAQKEMEASLAACNLEFINEKWRNSPSLGKIVVSMIEKYEKSLTVRTTMHRNAKHLAQVPDYCKQEVTNMAFGVVWARLCCLKRSLHFGSNLT